MKQNNAKKQLFEDYKALCERYKKEMAIYEFGFSLVQFATKTLMDSAPTHGVALETIKVATEEGIRWHVENKDKPKA